MNKGIVLSVIFLFIIVGFQPAFAIESRVTTDKEEKVEDCNCPIVNTLFQVRLERALARLQFTIHLIQVRFKDNPDILKTSNEILDIIKLDTPIWDAICDFIIGLASVLVEFANQLPFQGFLYYILIGIAYCLAAFYVVIRC